MIDGKYRAECNDCKWEFVHLMRYFAETAGENHESLYRTHPDDHETAVRYVEAGTEHSGGTDR